MAADPPGQARKKGPSIGLILGLAAAAALVGLWLINRSSSSSSGTQQAVPGPAGSAGKAGARGKTGARGPEGPSGPKGGPRRADMPSTEDFAGDLAEWQGA